STPETWGVAMDVPDRSLYPLGSHREHVPVGTVDSVLTPGAPRSTLARPKFVNEAPRSFWSVASTETIPRFSYAAGYIGEASAFWLLLPAAQTFVIPAASHRAIASTSA